MQTMSYQVVAGGWECVNCGYTICRRDEHHHLLAKKCPRCGCEEILQRLYQREVKPVSDTPTYAGCLKYVELIQQMIGSLDELGRDHFARADAIRLAKEYRRLARKIGVKVCD